MRIAIENVKIHQADGSFLTDTLYVENGRIAAPGKADQTVNGMGKLLCPGLIDMHTHGRAGSDFCEASEEQLRKMAADYAAHGITAVLPTLASDTRENWKAALGRIGNCGAASYIGIHMEGCWLSPARRGAHAAELLRVPDTEELTKLIAASPLPIRKVSAAPELDVDGSFIAACRKHGIHYSVGHTDADYAAAKLALDRGADSFTHLYNAMPPLHHRAGGPVAAAMTDDRAYTELICDGMHIAPEMVNLVYRTKGTDRLLLISDSMAGTGCPDGTYEIAGQPAIVKNGMALSPDGKLAGSTLSLLQGVQNLAKFCNIPFGKALLCATRTPAAYLGLEKDYGTLAIGARADLFLLDSENALLPARVMLDGEWI